MRKTQWVAVLAAGAALLASAAAVVPSAGDLALLFALFAVFTSPGWPLARWVAGRSVDPLTRLLLAVLLGYLAGASVYMLLRAVHVASPLLVVAACVALAAGLHLAIPRESDGLLRLARLEGRDMVGVALLWVIVAAIVGPVFARVGQPTASGLAYRAYFVADLFAHMSVVGELIKGASPPVNPYLPTESLPYYWAYFTFPAVYSALRPTVPLHAGILFADVIAAAVFVGVAYVVVRNLGASVLGTTASWAVLIVAGGLEGSYFLWRQWHLHRPFAELRTTNIDAVTRWIFQLPGTDGLQRLMWWTPQHELAITMGLLVLAATALARDRLSYRQAAFDGLLLGGAFAFSSFNGILLVGWYALSETVTLLIDRGRQLERWIATRAVAAVIVLAFVALTVVLGMIQRTPGAFIFGVNRYFLRGPWTFLALSFGPVLLLALVGVLPLVRRLPRLAVSMAAMCAVSAGAFLFFDVRGHENTYVVFRAAQLVLLMMAIALAFAVDWWRRWVRPLAAAMTVLLVLSTVASLPTLAIDWHNARDTSNVEMSPGGFPWTVHIGPYDQVAIRWIRDHVAEDATVQTDALVRARWGWAIVPAFALRRMGTGLGLFEPNPARFDANMARIHAEIYLGTDAAAARRTARALGIDYVYVGEPERRADAAGLAKLDQATDLFERVFAAGDVEIYRVK